MAPSLLEGVELYGHTEVVLQKLLIAVICNIFLDIYVVNKTNNKERSVLFVIQIGQVYRSLGWRHGGYKDDVP